MRSEIWKHFDYWLFGTVIILCIFGIAMIQSAIAGNVDLADYATRQIIWILIGLVVLIGTAVVDYHFWASLVKPMYAVTVVLLVIVYVLGKAKFGAARWIETGLISIQPAEIGKIVIILALADYFAKNEDKKHDIKWIVWSFIITAGIVVWIILQPNLSTSIVILVIWFSLLWMSGLNPKYILLFGILGIVAFGVAFPFLEQYQQLRIINFLVPNEQESYGNTYNVLQALISIGSGGLFGMGYGRGSQVQLRYLKVRHSDFIFAAMAEEFGFIGTAIIIALLFFVIIRILRSAKIANDTFGALLCYGFGIFIFFQTTVNIGVNLNLIPVTGLTLPFISYGGSSLVSLLYGIGLVESVVIRHKNLEF
jgi:rod shape determining protein RodA